MHEARTEVFIMPVTTQTPGESPRHEVLYDREGQREDQREGQREGQRENRVTRREHPGEVAHEPKISAATLARGPSLELIAGAAAVVLVIVGLAGYLPFYMTSIAAIAIGGALLAHGAAVTARRADTTRRAAGDRPEPRPEPIDLGGSAGGEFLGGAAAIVLGILALAGALPGVLLPVAAIVVGGTILLGAPAQPDPAPVAPDAPERDRRMSRLTADAAERSSGGVVLAGLGAIVLGILALVGVGPVYILVEVALLAVGVALLVGGGAMIARFGRRLQHLT
jgi:hypothetical protein